MKKLQWILVAVLTAMTMTVAPGCSKNDEPQYEPIPEYDGKSLIQNGKIYIFLYAPKGMKYAPVAKEDLPDHILNGYLGKSLDDAIIFEGEYNEQKAYWFHFIGSSQLQPHLLSISGVEAYDNGESYKEIDYTKLTCIYISEWYRHFGL